MVEKPEPKKVVTYACARPNLSLAVQSTAINVFTSKNPDLQVVARFEDMDTDRRTQLPVAIRRMTQGDCRGIVVYGVPILTQQVSHRETAEMLAYFLGPRCLTLWDVSGAVSQETILSLRNNAIAQIHRDVD